MKNTSLFMMFTLLGAPGFVIAADSDLANAEYNFTVNELSRSSLNQAAIIGQQGMLMMLRFARTGQNYCPLFLRMEQATERELINQGLIILPGSIRAVARMMQVLRKMDMVIVRKLSKKGRVIEQILRSTVRRKPQL